MTVVKNPKRLNQGPLWCRSAGHTHISHSAVFGNDFATPIVAFMGSELVEAVPRRMPRRPALLLRTTRLTWWCPEQLARFVLLKVVQAFAGRSRSCGMRIRNQADGFLLASLPFTTTCRTSSKLIAAPSSCAHASRNLWLLDPDRRLRIS